MQNIEASADVSKRAARALSKLVHGGAHYRIEIGAAIAETDLANTAELAHALGLSRQSVNQELKVLEQAGLLDRAPQIGSERKVYFLPRKESSYWAWCQEALAAAQEMLDRAPRY